MFDFLLFLFLREKKLTFEKGLHRPQERDLRVRGDRRGGVLELPGKSPLRGRGGSGSSRSGRGRTGDSGRGGGLLPLPKVLGPSRGDDEPSDRQDGGRCVKGRGGAQGEGLDEDVGEEAGCVFLRFFRIFFFFVER